MAASQEGAEHDLQAIGGDEHALANACSQPLTEGRDLADVQCARFRWRWRRRDAGSARGLRQGRWLRAGRCVHPLVLGICGRVLEALGAFGPPGGAAAMGP